MKLTIKEVRSKSEGVVEIHFEEEAPVTTLSKEVLGKNKLHTDEWKTGDTLEVDLKNVIELWGIHSGDLQWRHIPKEGTEEFHGELKKK